MISGRIDLNKFKKEERKSMLIQWNRNQSDFLLEGEKNDG